MEAAERYVCLGLRLGRHVEGLVDFAYGPAAQLRDAVDAEPIPEPASLVEEAEALAEATWPDGTRGDWLRSLLRGLHVYAHVLAGEDVAYADEVEGCYGVRPRRVPEEAFADAHERLEALLPGGGPLLRRYEAWRESQRIPADALARAVNSLLDVLRERTRDLVGLPDGERVEVEQVRGEHWLAFNYYLGGLGSRIAICVDLPIAHELVELIAHEAYPGHHTEHAWKERRLVEERGFAEEAASFVPTPAALVAEGIAEIGLGLALDDAVSEQAAAIVGEAVPSYDRARAKAIADARKPLAHVSGNAALLVHEGGASPDEVRSYVERWGLLARRRAERSVAFVTDPTWRAYATAYTAGLRLCRAFVRGEVGRFRRLLTEQVTVEELLAAGDDGTPERGTNS